MGLLFWEHPKAQPGGGFLTFHLDEDDDSASVQTLKR